MKCIALLSACLAPFSLAACGQAPKPQSGPPSAVGVFTSAQDCAASEKLKLADCSALLQQAMYLHQQGQKTYTSQRLCEVAEGPDQCERAENNSFRRRLLAFQVTFSSPPASAPLYAPKEKGVIGFSTLDTTKTLLAIDETLIFSSDAKFVAEGIN